MKYRVCWVNRHDGTCGHAERTYPSRAIAQSWADQANNTDPDNNYYVEMVSDAGPVARCIIDNQKNLVRYDTYDWDFSLN